MTALHLAVKNGQNHLFKLIMENVDDKNPIIHGNTLNPLTPFHLAAKNGNFPICQLIMDSIENKIPPGKLHFI